ncbi:hypothetical protein ABFX02_04G133300 [Erythranthe guttata]
MASVMPIPSIQDLRVIFHEKVLVSPSEKTERKSMFLSNIDQMHNYNAHTARFFTANPDYPPKIVTERLKMALEKVLATYDFAAGRLRTNQESGRLEIECDGAGAGFVAASSEYSLCDLGDDLVFSNPGFRQLSVLFDFLPRDDEPLLILQVTSFKCGGFAIGTAMNHTLVDGAGAQKLLAPKSPNDPNSLMFDISRDKAVTPLPLPSNKTTALSRSVNSTYNVVAALMWRCRALSSDKERVVLIPPLPDSYCGNAVLYAEASAKGGDIEKLPFSKLVELVWEGPRRFSDEYARSVIDLLEIEKWKLRPRIEYNVTSWLKLGLDQVVYPWGKPLCVGPICTVLAHACFLFPSVEGGVNALVSLPSEEMQRFQAYFHQFFT